MTIDFLSRAERRLASIRGWINAAVNEPYDPAMLAEQCKSKAKELNGAAGDLRRSAKQRKKAGNAGASDNAK